MDFLKNLAGNSNSNNPNSSNDSSKIGQAPIPTGNMPSEQSGGGSGTGGFLGGLGERFNSAAGGGVEGEKREDYLDKGVDFVQERFMGQGQQSNESAFEQAKDEQISDYIRGQYKGMSGTDFPIKDK